MSYCSCQLSNNLDSLVHSMDVAVNSYIPLWLLQVNEQQNVVRTSIPTKDPEQERRLYIASFSGTDAWQPHQFSAEGAQSMPEALQRQFKEHLRRIARLVELEGQDLVNLSKSWNRYQVPLKALSVAKEARNGLTETSFMCHVAGIQEFRPPVAIGDVSSIIWIELCEALNNLVGRAASADALSHDVRWLCDHGKDLRCQAVEGLRRPKNTLDHNSFRTVQSCISA